MGQTANYWIINTFVVATSVAEINKKRLKSSLRTILLALALTSASLSLWIEAYAQQPNSPSGLGTPGVWKTYRHSDGLASNWVYAFLQDRDGNIWFGTSGTGVSKFDGKNWKTYTTEDGLAGNAVSCILQAQDGAIWFGVWGKGVNRFDGTSWILYSQEAGLASNYVRAIFQDKNGVLWFGTTLGVSRFDGKTWKNYSQRDGLAGNVVRAIIEDRDGFLWVGTDGGASQFDGKSWKSYTEKDGLTSNSVSTILQDRSGSLWFGGQKGVSRYDGISWSRYTHQLLLPAKGIPTEIFHLPIKGITKIVQDHEGTLWFGTYFGVGVVRFDGTNWTVFSEKDGLANNEVTDMILDREGAIWFATEGGVSRFEYKGWTTYTEKDGLGNNEVWGITQDRTGALWFGTWGGGASRFDGKKWLTLTKDDGLTGNLLDRAILQDRDGIFWFGTFEEGISRYDGKRWTIYTPKDGLASGNVVTIIQARDGTIWVGAGKGVSKFDGKRWTTYTQKDGLGGSYAGAICEDRQGALWFGLSPWSGIGGGVSRYDGTTWTNYTQRDGLANNVVHDALQDRKGVLWFATEGGVSRFDGKSWTTFSRKDGLASDNVRDIAEDQNGKLWFATLGGVSRFDGKAFQSLNSKDGLPDDSVYSLCVAQDGSIWFGTESGVVRFIPNRVKPLVYITEVMADQHRQTPKDSLRLPAGIRRLAISYHGVSFKTRPGGMKYFYQLVGKDNDWQGPISEEMVEYFNLKPGNYTFKVQAVDRDLNYSEIASIQMTIPQSIGLYLLIAGVIAVLSIGYGAYRFGKYRLTLRAIAQQFNPYIAGKAVPEEMFFGREELLTDIEKTIINNCLLIYGERRIGKTSLLHQLQRRLKHKDDAMYQFIPAFIDLQWVKEENFLFTLGEGIIEACKPYFKGELELRHPSVGATHASPNTDDIQYTSRDLTRDIRAILEHLSKNTQKTAKIVLLLDEVDTLNSYNLKTNLALRSLFMGSFRENLTLVMAGFYLKKDWSDQGEGSPPFNFLSREIHVEPLSEEAARELIEKPVKDFYSYEPAAVELILKESRCRPFWIQAFGIRLTNRVSSEGRRRILLKDVEAIKESVLLEIKAIAQSERKASLPSNLNDAIGRIVELEQEVAKLREQ